MHDLQLVGFTTDRRGLIFRTGRGARGDSYVVPLTDELVAVVAELAGESADGTAAGPAAAGDEPMGAGTGSAAGGGSATDDAARDRPRSQLSVRDIQSRLRAGEPVAQVAAEAGVDEEWIERFAPPVRAEQRRVVERALECHLERARAGVSAVPLRRAVGMAMADKGIAFTVAAFDAGWSSHLIGHDRWAVEFTYRHRGRDHTATWIYDAEADGLTTSDRTASQIGYVPGSAKVRDDAGVAVDGIIGDPGASTQIGVAEPAPTPRRARTAKAAAASTGGAAPASPARGTAVTRPRRKKPGTKAATKKAAAKKAATKKAGTKRAVTKRAVTKKAVTKKAVTKKAGTKKAGTKKAGTKKAATKRAVTKKAATKRAVTKKAVTKKASGTKKAGTKKAGTKKAATKKAATKSPATRKVATTRSAPEQAPTPGTAATVRPVPTPTAPIPAAPTTVAPRPSPPPIVRSAVPPRPEPAAPPRPEPAAPPAVPAPEGPPPRPPAEERMRVRSRRTAPTRTDHEVARRPGAVDLTEVPLAPAPPRRAGETSDNGRPGGGRPPELERVPDAPDVVDSTASGRADARRARAAERNAPTVQFRSGSAVPVRRADPNGAGRPPARRRQLRAR
jgi:hypothetical protein